MVANFFTTEPVKNLTITRGNGADSTSQVKVADPDATDGYIIRAKLTADISADFSVNIWSDASTLCTSAHRCLLTTTDQAIYVNDTDSATTEPDGDTIDFNVRINSDTGAAIDTYNATIEYTKTRASFMHNFSSTKCGNMDEYPNTGSELDLIDYRDGKTYKIRKLADGKCWTMNNLALSGRSLNPLILDSKTTDMESGTYSLGVMPTGNDASNNYCRNLNPAIHPYKCGNLYTWAAAGVGFTTGNGEITPYSICPKNWRLPTGGASGEYTTLFSYLSVISGPGVPTSAWQGLYSGYATSSGTLTNVSSDGRYWTATGGTGSNQLGIYYTSSSAFNLNNSQSRADYLAVRCVAR
ncbi:MAG: hypothetical protein LBL84_03425 [Candidatus Nomurabacteria bacterium]|jgi:uncharacterized protein (TIGR02145 family)|nr:hypothetical protein [Candidatus Nomurabacteria bacterium]